MKQNMDRRIALHTFQLVKVLTNDDTRKLETKLFKDAKEQYRIFEKGTSSHESKQLICDRFADKGVTIKIRKGVEFPNSLELRVNPVKLLGYQHPSTTTFCPNKKQLSIMEDAIDGILRECGLSFTFQQTSIARIDSCCDFLFEEQAYVDAYLKVIKKGLIPCHYNQVQFDSKKPDANIKNKHSYRICCKEVTITAYDKVFEVKHEKLLESDNNPYPMLRVEVSMKRTTLTRRIMRKDKKLDNKTVLLEQYRTSREILCDYVGRMTWSLGRYITYEEAEQLIDGSDCSGKVRKRMKYLLRKTSDSDNLSNAIGKMIEKFDLHMGAVQSVKLAFSRLNISPVTLPNRSQIRRLPSVADLLSSEKMTEFTAY